MTEIVRLLLVGEIVRQLFSSELTVSFCKIVRQLFSELAFSQHSLIISRLLNLLFYKCTACVCRFCRPVLILQSFNV